MYCVKLLVIRMPGCVITVEVGRGGGRDGSEW